MVIAALGLLAWNIPQFFPTSVSAEAREYTPVPLAPEPVPTAVATEEPEPLTGPPANPLFISIPDLGIDHLSLTAVADIYTAGKPVNNSVINWWSEGGRPGDNPENKPGGEFTPMLYCHTSDWGAMCNDAISLTAGAAMLLEVEGGAIYHLELVQTGIEDNTEVQDSAIYNINDPLITLLTVCYRGGNHIPGYATTAKLVMAFKIVDYVPAS